jgi:cytoskeletal protein CcmA (bactofilin family)
MWKRNETESATDSGTQMMGSVTTAAPVMPSSAPAAASSGSRAVIGGSLRFTGDISGEEDLLVMGSLEGTVTVKSSTVTVGRGGTIKGNVYAKNIIVEGDVHGDLLGGEQVIVRKTGLVRGNITAPIVSLDAGAKLKGTIDMDPSSAEASGKNGYQSKGKASIEMDGTQSSSESYSTGKNQPKPAEKAAVN